MLDLIGTIPGERWYPLTYPGYYSGDLAEQPSLRCEHCRLDVSDLRGLTVGLQAVCTEGESRCTLTDVEGTVLAQWETPPRHPANSRHRAASVSEQRLRGTSRFLRTCPCGRTEKAQRSAVF